MIYLVITSVPEAPNFGNLALPGDKLFIQREQPSEENKFTGTYEEVNILDMMFLRMPVFSAGEVLITKDGERECVGWGRKPAKWDVQYESYHDLDIAVKRAIEVRGI